LADGFNCGSEAAEIFEIEIEEIGFFGEQSFSLGWIAAQNRNLRFRCVILTICRMSKCLLGRDGGKKLR
jgi:hypothetical protein